MTRFLTLILTLSCLQGMAQKQNNNWIFGVCGWINFNSAPPTVSTSAISAVEGCAIVSDRHTGKMLFYTEGTRIWNSQELLMPNGSNIGTDIFHDCAQGSLIVPFPNDTNRYYVFTLDNMHSSGCLRYSVVDMRLDGGLGDVDPAHKAILIDSNYTEALTSVNVCNSVWLATIKRTSNDFHFFKISESGIDLNPVVSPKNYARGSNGITFIKISRDKQRIALATYNGTDMVSYIALHDLSLLSGKVSNGVIIDSAVGRPEYYSCEFSWDCKKLFSTLYTSKKICQYDISLPTAADICASRVVVDSESLYIGAMQMGPDNAIYISKYLSKSVDRIIDNHLMFPGCKYQRNAITLPNIPMAMLGLPQSVMPLEYMGPILTEATHDTVVCHTASVTLRGKPGHSTYIWNNATNADTCVVTSNGKYWVKTIDSCFEHTDTFVLKIRPYQYVNLGNDTAICEGVNTTFSNKYANLPGSTFLWNTGSTDSTITLNKAGSYWLAVAQGNCWVSDTINVNTNPFPHVSIGKDTTICENTEITLYCNPQNPGVSYLWNTGSVSEQTKTNGEGVYTLIVNDKGCKADASVTISHMPLPVVSLGGDADVCFPGFVSLPYKFIKGVGYSFLWSTGSTDTSITVDKEGIYKVKLTNVCGTVTDSMQFKMHSCSIWFPTAFSPNGDGRNDVLRLQGDVKGVTRFSLMIYNRWGQRVYGSSDPYSGWDGTFNGQPAESATYYYMMRALYGRKEEVWKGGVTIIR